MGYKTAVIFHDRLCSGGREEHRFWSAGHKIIPSVSLVEVIRNASKMSPQALNAWFCKPVWPDLPAIIYVIYMTTPTVS